MGVFTVSVMEGQLETNRIAIADGKPYRVHATLYAPPKPAFMLTTKPEDTQQGQEDEEEEEEDEEEEGRRPYASPGVSPQNGAAGEASAQGPVERDSGAAAEEGLERPKGNKVAMTVVIVVSIVSFSVLTAGLVFYLRGKESPPVGFTQASPLGSPTRTRGRQN